MGLDYSTNLRSHHRHLWADSENCLGLCCRTEPNSGHLFGQNFLHFLLLHLLVDLLGSDFLRLLAIALSETEAGSYLDHHSLTKDYFVAGSVSFADSHCLSLVHFADFADSADLADSADFADFADSADSADSADCYCLLARSAEHFANFESPR